MCMSGHSLASSHGPLALGRDSLSPLRLLSSRRLGSISQVLVEGTILRADHRVCRQLSAVSARLLRNLQRLWVTVSVVQIVNG